jgi:hypothetical protein
MANTYLYGLIGRRIKIGKTLFFGYQSYPTKEKAEKEAEEARSKKHLARVIQTGNRFVLMVSVEKVRK